MRGTEAGFSLIEILIAAALFVVVAFGAFETVRQVATNATHLRARHLGYAAVERLTSQLRAEARSATAIWTSSPVAGGGHDDCVQLDFYAADANGSAFWSYRTFPNHGSGDAIAPDALERLAGTAPIAACDTSQAGQVVLSGLQSPPLVTTVAPGTLASHQDAYVNQNDSGFVAAGVPSTRPIALGVLDANRNPVNGGNTVVELRLDTADASRVIDLVPGVFPNGFTETLRYTCSERCDVGHDSAGPKTLTACTMSWQTQWSEYVHWNDYRINTNGTLTAPSGWFIAGYFVFTYSGTRASDGGLDTLVKYDAATNWDTTRDYNAYPPDRAAADGSSSGSFAPWDVRSESAAAWYADFGPYVALTQNAAIGVEKQRCDAVQQAGTSNGFYTNG